MARLKPSFLSVRYCLFYINCIYSYYYLFWPLVNELTKPSILRKVESRIYIGWCIYSYYYLFWPLENEITKPSILGKVDSRIWKPNLYPLMYLFLVLFILTPDKRSNKTLYFRDSWKPDVYRLMYLFIFIFFYLSQQINKTVYFRQCWKLNLYRLMYLFILLFILTPDKRINKTVYFWPR